MYSAPITRKTLVNFNGLNFWAIPRLPQDWIDPTWLKIELGIFSGRLYFEYDEYESIREYIGLQEAPGKLTEEADNVTPEGFGADGAGDDAEEEADSAMNKSSTRSFTAKPLAFLQEWLAVRRRGQDFAHTPMGYVCQGKPLVKSHPFFAKLEVGIAVPKSVNHGNVGSLAVEEDAVSDGEEMFGEEDGIYCESGEEDDVVLDDLSKSEASDIP